MKNPFEVSTPEGISAEDVHELFVDVFTDFYQVPKFGHTFLNGPRGSGKSMMFRFMMPDCQKIKNKCKLSDLDYFSLYAPIKLTELNNHEIGALNTNSAVFINEHLLTNFITIKCFKSLQEFESEIDQYFDLFNEFYKSIFLWYIDISGFDISQYNTNFKNSKDCLNCIIRILEKIYRDCLIYCKRSLFVDISYYGPLFSYLDFLYPILLELKKLPFLPQNKPLFILIDDAGYLNEMQTQILNTWVSYRTSHEVSLKISTQLDYKSFKTTTNKTIDSPHDYSQVNIATIYTTSQNNYYKRINDIVKKRLKTYLKKEIDPFAFFPNDEKQLNEINEIKNKLRVENYSASKKYAAGDAARRYASSEYMKILKSKRSGSTLSYAGFDNLVDISSGIIRHFLEPASIMFSEVIARYSVLDIEFIPDSIQDDVIQNYSRKFLEDEFAKIHELHGKKSGGEVLSKADKLYNLITSLGEIFHKIFISNKAERVVFSVALNDSPDIELKEILDLAEHYGYIHKSTIGNKNGTGRVRLYILSRTLAPYFKLDPTGFKGYQFMNSSVLKLSLTNPKKFIKEITQDISGDRDIIQLNFFENEN
ncbi:ORC-CDC6 family AAA ATPase [Runella salmonicolor]|uniref:Uncharacterized protein n=1 Tax=Runella salmonicolor TaxID=2950278 RepID=A0ABT1FVW5_9BACT|nr:hypothetical protein [Runella salmonicolor]MCP1384813.1 hypothetical protein [Runella salmonicolor]